MSNENTVFSHELVVRFDEDDNRQVSWSVRPDDMILDTMNASYEELIEAGAPLSALGIRVLWELLGENLVVLALDRANNYLLNEYFSRLEQMTPPDVDDFEGTVVHDSEESAVLH